MRLHRIFRWLLFIAACVCHLDLITAVASQRATVLVTGATGRTGAQLYHQLRSLNDDAGGFRVRGLVRNATKARERLGCSRCDASEGIYYGDVTNPSTLAAAFSNVDAVVILTGSFPIQLPNGTFVYPEGGTPRDVDYLGTNNQVRAAVSAQTVKHIVFVSSMGTATPGGFLDLIANGHDLSYKLNAEAYLMQTSAASMARSIPLDFTIVKPSGLLPATGAPTNATFVIGHSDCLPACPSGNASSCKRISRDDLASFLAKTVTGSDLFRNARFDLSSDPAKAIPSNLKRDWGLLSKQSQDLNHPPGMGCPINVLL